MQRLQVLDRIGSRFPGYGYLPRDERRVELLAKKYYGYDDEEKKDKKGIFSRIDKWKLFKEGVKMVASGCASIVASRYLKSNMPEASSVFDKAVMGVGTYFLTGVVGAAASNYVEKELDDLKEGFISSMKEAENGGEID